MAMIISDIQYYASLFILWLLSSIILLTFFKKSTVQTHRLPPSPPSHPIIGHLHLVSRAFFDSFYQISSKYGPLLYLRLGAYHCVLVSSASMVTEIFKTQDINLSDKPYSPFKDSLLFGNSTFVNSPYGDFWKFMKRICVTKLLSARQIQRSRGIRREELMRFMRKLFDKASRNEVVDLSSEVKKLTNAGICRMAVSTKHSEEDGEEEMCQQLVVGALDLAGKINTVNVLGPLRGIMFRLCRKQANDVINGFDALLEKILKEHEERAKANKDGDREDKDLMDILLEAQNDETAEVKITRGEIKAFIIDLFVAGTSTTAETTQWAFAHLMNYPEVYKKVREEIESVVGPNRLVDESDIPNLPYLQAVVNETLRLCASVPIIPRANREDCKFGDYDIPKGTTILINAYAIMRDPKLWNNPLEFYPERFIEKENEETNNSFLPFGMGRRMCPGSALGLTTTKATLAALVQCFDWEVVGGDNGNKVDMKIGSSITFSMAHPILGVPKVRFNPLNDKSS